MIGMDFVAKGSSSDDSGKKSTTTADAPVPEGNAELRAVLTGKKNAISMLRARIDLLLSFLASGPPDQRILREIKALANSRLPLLTPADARAFDDERTREHADVNLVVLLGAVTKCIDDVRTVAKKSSGIESMARKKAAAAGGAGPDDGWDFAALGM